MIHSLLAVWFHWVDAWGYLGIFILMAMESSIIPVPSEVVMPPAAFWASQGRMSFLGVVLAGTAGSYFGSFLSYFISLYLGAPLVHKYGKFFFLAPDKLRFAERWVNQFGASGVFIARLLPVVRHLVSIPAGIFKMPFGKFSFSTLSGAGLWCLLLSWFGQQVIGDHPEVLESPEAMISVVKSKMLWFLAAVLVFVGLYLGVRFAKRKFEEVPL